MARGGGGGKEGVCSPRHAPELSEAAKDGRFSRAVVADDQQALAALLHFEAEVLHQRHP